MKNIYLFLILTIIIGNGIMGCKSDSCATKGQFLESYGQFLDEFNAQKANYNEDQRAESEIKFRAIVNDCLLYTSPSPRDRG